MASFSGTCVLQTLHDTIFVDEGCGTLLFFGCLNLRQTLKPSQTTRTTIINFTIPMKNSPQKNRILPMLECIISPFYVSIKHNHIPARVVKLVDTQDLKSCAFTGVPVRFRPRAPYSINLDFFGSLFFCPHKKRLYST